MNTDQNTSQPDLMPGAKQHTSCHHELKDGELWIGNINVRNGVEIPAHYRGLKTVRIGNQAYCIKGRPLDRNYMRPFIIHKSEVDKLNRIQMERVCNRRQ